MSEAIKLDAGIRAFEIAKADGSSFRWEYDIVAIKLMFERLESAHGLRTKDPSTGRDILSSPTEEFLQESASKLFEGCTTEAAYKVYHVICEQFRAMEAALKEQVKAIKV